MIDKNILYRIAVGIFAVHLLVASSMFLVGEFILGVDYMIQSSVLSVVVYFFVFIKWASQLMIVVSVVNSKFLGYRKGILFVVAIATFLCIFHLAYVFYFNSQALDEAIITMKADSFKNIALFAMYVFSIEAFARNPKPHS